MARDRCSGNGSTIPTSVTSGKPASTRAWLLPITPAPITPTRNARLISVLIVVSLLFLAPDADPLEFMKSTPTDFSGGTSRRLFQSRYDSDESEPRPYPFVLTRILEPNAVPRAKTL